MFMKKNLRKKNYPEAFRFMCQSGYFCLLGSFVSENPYLDFISMEWHTNTYMGSILSPICIICSIQFIINSWVSHFSMFMVTIVILAASS